MSRSSNSFAVRLNESDVEESKQMEPSSIRTEIELLSAAPITIHDREDNENQDDSHDQHAASGSTSVLSPPSSSSSSSLHSSTTSSSSIVSESRVDDVLQAVQSAHNIVTDSFPPIPTPAIETAPVTSMNVSSTPASSAPVYDPTSSLLPLESSPHESKKTFQQTSRANEAPRVPCVIDGKPGLQHAQWDDAEATSIKSVYDDDPDAPASKGKKFLSSRGRFSPDGLADGDVQYFYPDGELRAKVPYYHGLKHGTAISYSEYGSMLSVDQWRFDRLHGICREYHPEGTIAAEITWVDGQMDGVARFFQSDGETVTARVEFLNGKENGMVSRYYKNGRIMEEKRYVNGKKEGLMKVYWDRSSHLKVLLLYRDDVLDGEYRAFFENGVLEKEGSYAMGELDGECKQYNELGELMETRVYDKGVFKGGSGLLVEPSSDEQQHVTADMKEMPLPLTVRLIDTQGEAHAHIVQAHASYTVLDVKKMITKVEEISVKQMKLVLPTKELDDKWTRIVVEGEGEETRLRASNDASPSAIADATHHLSLLEDEFQSVLQHARGLDDTRKLSSFKLEANAVLYLWRNNAGKEEEESLLQR